MQSLTTTISVQVDKHDKEIATGILNNLGLNMSIYVNMAIKQLINKDGYVVGSIASMEDKGETLPDISRGQRVAMAIKDAIVGKDFEEGDELYVDIPEKHYKYIEREFKDKLTEDEFETLYEFLEIKRKQDPDWGSFGLFE